jgi:hypothetical protein
MDPDGTWKKQSPQEKTSSKKVKIIKMCLTTWYVLNPINSDTSTKKFSCLEVGGRLVFIYLPTNLVSCRTIKRIKH